MHIVMRGIKIPVYVERALVIGSGAAGLNCADELAARGIGVMIAADNASGGTSGGAGSDKQTYHKLSMEKDSAAGLASDLFAGGHMHGDTAYALAAGSLKAFFKLVGLGVPFPHDEWGEYAGYRTDHDPRLRATSAGPLTSNIMVKVLGESVRRRGVKVLRGSLVSLLTQAGRVCGALFMDQDASRYGAPALNIVLCRAVVLCTGGAAELYRDTVFPKDQRGALGAALRAGAEGANLWSWQYGLASKGDFRWNLSGTYQQALPRYVGTAQDPLAEWDCGDDAIFLKGYEWPFDARKIAGSSRVDLAVLAAIQRGEDVSLRYTRPDRPGRLEALGEEARAYLRNSGAGQNAPFERLAHMNPLAVDIFAKHGIDLAKDDLPIAVCAQHHNGGVAVDAWWRSSVPGLYAAGEAAGCFGSYRPGGSALNETQVGSSRAAQHIAQEQGDVPDAIGEELFRQIGREVDFLHELEGGDDAREMHDILRREFTLCAGPVRRPAAMRRLYEWVQERRASRHGGAVADVLALRDALDAAAGTLSSMLLQAQSMPTPAGHINLERPLLPDNLPAVPDERFFSQMIRTTLSAQGARSDMRRVRPLPQQRDTWFENVWRRYREGDFFGDAR